MIRTQVSFDAEMYERARAEARRQGVSFAELCRRAVAQLLRHRQEADQPWMRFAGAIDTGGPDASQSVDDAGSLAELLEGHLGVLHSSEQVPGGARMSEEGGKKFATGMVEKRRCGRL